MKIILARVNDRKAPLYRKYRSEHFPQSAFIQLTRHGVIADYSGEIGNAVPVSVWHGITRRYYIDARASRDALRRLQRDKTFLSLCKRVQKGLTEEYDGNNYVGVLTRDAEDAEQSLELYLDAYFNDYENLVDI